jgi:hypothetical protein
MVSVMMGECPRLVFHISPALQIPVRACVQVPNIAVRPAHIRQVTARMLYASEKSV